MSYKLGSLAFNCVIVFEQDDEEAHVPTYAELGATLDMLGLRYAMPANDSGPVVITMKAGPKP